MTASAWQPGRPQGKSTNEGTEVADEEGERDARDTDQRAGHVTLSVGFAETDPMHLVSSDSAPRPKKCGGPHAVDSETPPGPPQQESGRKHERG